MFVLTNANPAVIISVMRSLKRTLGSRLLRDIALVCLADSIVGMSFGAIAVGAGFDPWVPIALSLIVFAGAAQFLFIGLLAAGASPVAAVFAGVLVNARHLPFGLAIGDALAPKRPDEAAPARPDPADDGQATADTATDPHVEATHRHRVRDLARRVVGSHLMIDEAVAFAVAQDQPAKRRAAYWACGSGLFVCWNVGVVVGALFGRAVGDPETLGLDAALPAVLLALVLPALRSTGARRAALLGAVIALATTPVLPAGLPVLLALAALPLATRAHDDAVDGGAPA